jgi:integrase
MYDRWIARLKQTTSRDHWKQYEGYGNNHIKPVIGAKKIRTITQNDFQCVIDTAYNNPQGRKGKHKLSKKTLGNMRACLMSFIKFCRGAKVTIWHPETLTIPTGSKRSKKTILSAQDIVTLFSASTTVKGGERVEDMFIHAYRFLLLSGIRPGELIGLHDKDIKGRRVTINRSINIHNEVTDGKNENALRTYTLDHHAMQVLEDQKQMLKKLGWISPYVFPGHNRDHIKERTLYNAWKRYCESNGITNATTPYELRHTFVSVNTDMPDSLKKLVIGHGVNFDTHGTYGHEKAGDMDNAAAYISDAFNRILGW